MSNVDKILTGLFGFIENCKDTGYDLIFADIPEKSRKALTWVLNNPDMAITIFGLGISFLRATQSLVVSQRVYSERLRQDYRYYDSSNQVQWDLCRKLSNHDKSEILRRRKNGEDIYDILYSMNAIR